jgi:hypothetical protein
MYLAANVVCVVIREDAPGRKHSLVNPALAREIGQREATASAGSQTQVQANRNRASKDENSEYGIRSQAKRRILQNKKTLTSQCTHTVHDN